MKKSIKAISFLLCTVSLLVGCQKEETWGELAQASVNVREDVANIEEVTIEKDKINIKYPKLVDMENKKIEDKWNKIIEDRIVKDLELLSESDVYHLSYETAYYTKEELSIKLIGSCYYDGATEPFHFIYTYNISLTTGESIRLAEQFDIKLLASQIYQGKEFGIEEDKKEAFMEYINSAFENEELLAQMLNNFDYSQEQEQPYGYSFYEQGKLYLCIEVPHDIGDYVILTLDYDKKENKTGDEV